MHSYNKGLISATLLNWNSHQEDSLRPAARLSCIHITRVQQRSRFRRLPRSELARQDSPDAQVDVHSPTPSGIGR